MISFQAFYGREPTLVAKAALYPEDCSPESFFSLEDIATIIKENLLKAKERMKFFVFVDNMSDRSFQPRDMVYLKTQLYCTLPLAFTNI